MKLSKTQQKLLDEAKETIKIFNKYSSFEDFFINSKNEQNQLTTAQYCNGAYNTPEKFKSQNLSRWLDLEQSFLNARNKNQLLVYAKTETVKKLETLGLIKILEVCKSGFEYIEVL